MVSRPPLKTKQLKRSVKDPWDLNDHGVYRVPCECGTCNVGQTDRSTATRLKAHQWHLRLAQTDKPTLAIHGWERHNIGFLDTI